MMERDNTRNGACNGRAPFKSPLVKAMRRAKIKNIDDYPEFFYV